MLPVSVDCNPPDLDGVCDAHTESRKTKQKTQHRKLNRWASQTPPKSGGLQSTDTGNIGHKTQKVEKQNKNITQYVLDLID
jgi:hypothetical protein